MADYRTSGILNTDGSGTVNVGLANNNPGDLKCCDGNNWQGLVGNNGTFDTFVDTTWGLRAIAVDLMNKINNDGLDTITDIITAYAPPSENNTASYIASVVSDTGIAADTQLGTDADTISSLVRAIVNHEIGDTLSAQYVPDSDIDTGVGWAQGGAASTLLPAAIIAVQQDPMIAIAVVGLVAVMVWVLWEPKSNKTKA
jgi:hypothetical protein